MATRTKTVQDYVKEAEAEEKKKMQSAYADMSAQNTAASQQYIQGMNTAMDTAADNTRKQYGAQIETLPQKYQSLYDANAINQMVAERQVAERMENLGLTDSGLNRTQQTALQVSRMNADNAGMQQQSAAARALEKELDNYLANIELQKAQLAAEENKSLAQQNQALYTNLYNNMQSNVYNTATGMYQADTEAETARQQAMYDYQTAQLKAQQQAAEKKESRDNDISAFIYDINKLYASEGKDEANKKLNELFIYGKITAEEARYISQAIAKLNPETTTTPRATSGPFAMPSLGRWMVPNNGGK